LINFDELIDRYLLSVEDLANTKVGQLQMARLGDEYVVHLEISEEW
jgi:hypothetical protein